MLIAVTPPASARYTLIAVGLSTSVMRTMLVTDNDPSLIASAIMWECGSMMPGRMYFPEASITLAPAGAARLLPMFAIFPFWISRSLFASVPFVTVRMVAFLMSVVPLAGTACCAGSVEAQASASAARRIVLM
jgi:hypothetical protein